MGPLRFDFCKNTGFDLENGLLPVCSASMHVYIISM